MKKFTALLLVCALALTLCACGEKEEAAAQEPGAENPQAAEPAAGTSGDGAETLEQKLARKEQELAAIEDYWERLEAEREWDEEINDGYVWTINIDQVSTFDMMGLMTANYDLKLSCSHVGPTMLGVYSGELEMSYDGDLDNLMELLTVLGGSAEYDADGWFKNENYLMRLMEYDAEDDEAFGDLLGKTDESMSEQEQAASDAYAQKLLEDVGSGDEPFELEKTPAGYWYDWDFHMTEGDMSGFLEMTGIVYGAASGSGGVDASGTSLAGSAYASAFGMSFSERYAETVQSPFPYVLRVYETGEVVFELHSANGGPVTVKFYGTIDKVPVEQTQTAG